MKYLKFKNINLPSIIIILFFSFNGNSQNIVGNINSSGNNATSSTGTVSYSIGQVFYTYIGQSVYNVAQGIQHEDGSLNLTAPKINVESKTEILVFPNPTIDYVTINIKGFVFENGIRSYKLYDYQGRLLKQNTINQAETQVDLNNFSPSLYMLTVCFDNEIFKTFKIIKK